MSADAQPELIFHIDGASRGNPGEASFGVYVQDGQGRELGGLYGYLGKATNNVAEYRALIEGVKAARRFPSRVLRVRADSLLVINQVAGKWKIKQAHLRPLAEEARALLDAYDEVDLAHVPRAQNADADLLVNAALDAP